MSSKRESEGRHFSIHRLARYGADLSELCRTGRVVPVVVFLRGAPGRRALKLGSERRTYPQFSCIACELAVIPYRLPRDSRNLVARLNLPKMLPTVGALPEPGIAPAPLHSSHP